MIVTAEFPWSIRNAVLNKHPEIKSSKKQIDFDLALNKYIEKNLILKNKTGTPLKLNTITPIETNGHSHQNTFKIEYIGSKAISINNTILFDLYSTQKNTHKYGSDNFTTTLKNPHYLIKDRNPVPLQYSIAALILVFAFMGLIVFKKRNPVVFDRIAF